MQPLKSLDQYWASLPKEEFLDYAHKKIHDFYDDLMARGLFQAVEMTYEAYYGANLADKTGGKMFDAIKLGRGGDSGEITLLKANHFRNLLKHTLQLATSNKAAVSCRATNTDYKSQTQTILGKGVVDYYFSEKKVGRQHAKAVENGLITTEGWVHTPWNATKGKQFDVHPDTGAAIYEGDLDFSVKTLLDVPRDINLSEDDEFPWLFVRERVNKWDLAAKYPEHAQDIINISSSDGTKYEDLESFRFNTYGREQEDSDGIWLWYFYHDKSESMKQGRLLTFVGDIVLSDGPTPYDKIPLWRFSPDRIIGTPYGYTPAFEILGVQQGIDILSSTIMSNNANFGVQSIWTKQKDNLSVTNLGGGLKNLQSDEKPEPIQLTNTAPETYEFRKQLIGEGETLMGVSATVRGNPEASLKSGSALALVVSQSIQFAYLIEEDSNSLMEDLGTAIIVNIRTFGKTPRIANIIGDSSRPFMEEFTGDDLSEINRVVIEQVNPLSKTISGRIQLAENLADRNLIKDANQYIMVLTTGSLDPAIEGVQHQTLNIRAENEEMRKGRAVVAVITDNHANHIMEHSDLLANPESRKNPAFVKMVLDHNQEHLDLWRNADPAILFVTGQQPAPPPAMMPQAPGRMPPPQGGAPAGPQVGPAPSPVADQLPQMPNKPSLPEGAPAQAKAAYEDAQLDAA